MASSSSLWASIKGKLRKSGGANSFATLDEAKAPNVKQYLRGLRNYYILSSHIKVSHLFEKIEVECLVAPFLL